MADVLDVSGGFESGPGAALVGGESGPGAALTGGKSPGVVQLAVA